MATEKHLVLEKAATRLGERIHFIIDGEGLCVEEAAMKYYQKEGYSSMWTENGYWWTLMALCFWDVIFLKIKGAVRIGGAEIEIHDRRFEPIFETFVRAMGSPYDFFSPQFYERCREYISRRIRELESRGLEEEITQSYLKHRGVTCRGVDWNRYNLDQFSIPGRRLGDRLVLKILERLISNYGKRRCGFPDLTVYDDEKLFFCEVKSEGDVVSKAQKEWHEFLSNDLKMKVEILHVHAQD